MEKTVLTTERFRGSKAFLSPLPSGGFPGGGLPATVSPGEEAALEISGKFGNL